MREQRLIVTYDVTMQGRIICNSKRGLSVHTNQPQDRETVPCLVWLETTGKVQEPLQGHSELRRNQGAGRALHGDQHYRPHLVPPSHEGEEQICHFERKFKTKHDFCSIYTVCYENKC